MFSVSPRSRCSRVSPAHRIGVNPARCAALNFAATVLSLSLKRPRRSEWPTIAKRQPSIRDEAAVHLPVACYEPRAHPVPGEPKGGDFTAVSSEGSTENAGKFRILQRLLPPARYRRSSAQAAALLPRPCLPP